MARTPRISTTRCIANPIATASASIVAIADVSHYVRPGTPLDDEATKRATSVYFPGFVVPMLPETLSNGICSLKPKVDRLCFVCDMQVDRDGEVTHVEVLRSGDEFARAPDLHAGLECGGRGHARRGSRPGAGVHRSAAAAGRSACTSCTGSSTRRGRNAARSSSRRREVRFVLGPQGEVTQAGMIQRNDAHKLIEECMIAANVQAAEFLLAAHDPGAVSRPRQAAGGQVRRPAGVPQGIQAAPAAVGARCSRAISASCWRPFATAPDAALLESVVLRSQSLAVYAPDNIGHFGLALAAYAHFTSPIRRYPDLLVHRAIKHALAGGKPDSYRYSAARDGRAVAAVFRALASRRRSRSAKSTSAIAPRGWNSTSAASSPARSAASPASACSSSSTIPRSTAWCTSPSCRNDFYHFDPIRKTLTGERRGREYRLGDRVEIVVLKASVEDRRIDFRLVEDPGAVRCRTAAAARAAGQAQEGRSTECGHRSAVPESRCEQSCRLSGKIRG